MLLSWQAMGMTLPYSSSIPAEDPLKRDECRMAGKALLNIMQKDIKPRDIMVCGSPALCQGCMHVWP